MLKSMLDRRRKKGCDFAWNVYTHRLLGSLGIPFWLLLVIFIFSVFVCMVPFVDPFGVVVGSEGKGGVMGLKILQE